MRHVEQQQFFCIEAFFAMHKKNESWNFYYFCCFNFVNVSFFLFPWHFSISLSFQVTHCESTSVLVWSSNKEENTKKVGLNFKHKKEDDEIKKYQEWLNELDTHNKQAEWAWKRRHYWVRSAMNKWGKRSQSHSHIH